MIPKFAFNSQPKSTQSSPNGRLIQCSKSCQSKKTGFLKMLHQVNSPSRSQASFLGVECKSESNVIEPVIIRVNTSTDLGGNFQSMLQQITSRISTDPPLIFRLNLKAETSLNCGCDPFACFKEKANPNAQNDYDRYLLIMYI